MKQMQESKELTEQSLQKETEEVARLNGVVKETQGLLVAEQAALALLTTNSSEASEKAAAQIELLIKEKTQALEKLNTSEDQLLNMQNNLKKIED